MPFKDREVQKAYDREKYKKNRERIIELRMRRYALNKEKEAAYQKQYAEENRKNLSAYHKKWKRDRSAEQKKKDREYARQYRNSDYRKNPDKIRARLKVYYAIKTGKLKRPDHCLRCGLICTPQGHHPDYSKPLKVVWLCDSCHKKEHS
jgi:hypothetical protein